MYIYTIHIHIYLQGVFKTTLSMQMFRSYLKEIINHLKKADRCNI